MAQRRHPSIARTILFTITLPLLVSLTRGALAHQRIASAFMTPQIIRNNQSAKQTENIVLPEKEYGYATKPYAWSDLVDIIQHEQNLAKLSRSVEQEREYQEYRRGLDQEWKSIYHYLLHSKFNFEKRIVNTAAGGEEIALWEAYPPLSEVSAVQKSLRPNDFPYYMAEGIEHWCLWKLCADVSDEDIEHAKEDLRLMHGDVTDFLHWKNPPHLKSLPDIDHVHILCRRGPL